MQHTTQHSSFCATHHKKRNARLFYTKQQMEVKWRSLWWHRKFWHSRLWVSQLPGCCCNRLCGNLVVKDKGTDGLVNRLYKKNSTWKGIYNGTTKRREWNNGFWTYRSCMSCCIVTAYDVVIMYDPLTAVHYESSSVPFVDWIFFNSIEHGQIPQLETKFILMTRRPLSNARTWTLHRCNLSSIVFLVFFIGCPLLGKKKLQ